MFRLPSLSFSYTVSTGTAPHPHMESMKELEVMGKKVQSLMTTMSELSSQLRQMKSREENCYKKEDGDVNLLYATSSSLMQCDGTRQTGGELEAASRLVGEVHMATPAFPEENARRRKFGGKGERFNEEVDHYIGAGDQEETENLTSTGVKEEMSKHMEEGDCATGLERGKNPVCLLQELLVANNATHLPKYHLVGEYGPGHSKIFTVHFFPSICCLCYLFHNID